MVDTLTAEVAARAPDAARGPAIEAVGLTKRYGDKTAVDDLHLRIPAGEVFGLLGPNGAGKTTTILMLLGLTEPSAGSVRVDGLDPTRDALAVKRRVGYLPDDVGFYDELTGRQNLAYTAALNRLPRREAAERVDELLAVVGLVDDADRKVRGYSRGMRQRLGLADALRQAADDPHPRRADGEHRPPRRPRAPRHRHPPARRARRDRAALLAPAASGRAGVRPHRDLRRRAPRRRRNASRTCSPPSPTGGSSSSPSTAPTARSGAPCSAFPVSSSSTVTAPAGGSTPAEMCAATSPAPSRQPAGTSSTSPVRAPTWTASTTATSEETRPMTATTTPADAGPAGPRSWRMADHRPQGARRSPALGALRHPRRARRARRVGGGAHRQRPAARCRRRRRRDPVGVPAAVHTVARAGPAFHEFVGILGPLLGIAFGFDAINAERAQRTLPRLGVPADPPRRGDQRQVRRRHERSSRWCSPAWC